MSRIAHTYIHTDIHAHIHTYLNAWSIHNIRTHTYEIRTYTYIRAYNTYTCVYIHTYIHTYRHFLLLSAGRQPATTAATTTTTTTTEPKPLCFCPVYSLLVFSFRISSELFFSMSCERATNLPRNTQPCIAVIYLIRL
jgi:hypothetical protein